LDYECTFWSLSLYCQGTSETNSVRV